MPKTRKKAKSATRPSDYFPDIDEWPNNWMGTKEDLEIGRGLLALFTPFIQHLIDEGLAKKTTTQLSRAAFLQLQDGHIKQHV